MTPARWQLVWVLLFATAVTIVGFVIIRQRMAPTVQAAHTEFLFYQLADNYSRSVPTSAVAVASEREFLDLVPQWTIDWNSCEFKEGEIYDGFGNKVQVQAQANAIKLWSAGPDGQFETPDDIVKELLNQPIVPGVRNQIQVK